MIVKGRFMNFQVANLEPVVVSATPHLTGRGQRSRTSHGTSFSARTEPLTYTHANQLHAEEFPSLLRAAQGGDERAFATLIRQYRRVVEGAAQRILSTDEYVADAVQEATYKIYRALPRFEDGNFCSWITRIVTNTCYDHLRRQKRRQAYSLDALTDFDKGKLLHGARPVDEVVEPERVALQRERMQMMLDAIDRLPRRQRSVVLLVDIHGMDYDEAAQYLDVPMGTIKSRLSRARATLRDELTALGMVPNGVV